MLWQVALPLTYYLDDYKNDERFSWRMFSYWGGFQSECTVKIDEEVSSFIPGRAVAQGPELWTGDWLNLLKRGRPAVVSRFLRKRCHDNPYATDVHLIQMCPTADRSKILSGEIVFNCKSGTMSKGEW